MLYKLNGVINYFSWEETGVSATKNDQKYTEKKNVDLGPRNKSFALLKYRPVNLYGRKKYFLHYSSTVRHLVNVVFNYLIQVIKICCKYELIIKLKQVRFYLSER